MINHLVEVIISKVNLRRHKIKIPATEFDVWDLVSQLIYYSSDGRTITGVYCGNRKARVPDPTTLLENCSTRRTKRSSEAETFVRQYSPIHGRQERAPFTNIPNDRCSINRGNGSWRTSLRQEIGGASSWKDTMFQFMCEHPHVPMDAIVRSSPWLNSKFRFVRTSDSNFRDVVDVFNSYICNYSVEELAHFWGTRSYLYWDTRNSQGEGFQCMSLHDSIEWGTKLLYYQFENEDALVKDFLNNMYKLLKLKIRRTVSK
jgi:hypothetical protein